MIRNKSRLASTGEFVGDMGRLFADDVRSTYQEASQQNRRGKIEKAIWGVVLTGYTVADDVPMGIFYSAVEHAHGTAPAVAAVGGLSSGIAGALAMIQRRRKINGARSKGTELEVQDGSIVKDVVSTYGIGAPATVLAYESGTVPSMRRTLAMASFYGVVGQGASYAGFETAGEAIHLHPKAALAIGILGAAAARYGFAVRDIRRQEADADPVNIPEGVVTE
jgi:hypothetical protein